MHVVSVCQSGRIHGPVCLGAKTTLSIMQFSSQQNVVSIERHKCGDHRYRGTQDLEVCVHVSVFCL